MDVYPAFVVAEYHVQDSVQKVFDRPMVAYMTGPMRIAIQTADSEKAAWIFRFDLARRSEMISRTVRITLARQQVVAADLAASAQASQLLLAP